MGWTRHTRVSWSGHYLTKVSPINSSIERQNPGITGLPFLGAKSKGLAAAIELKVAWGELEWGWSQNGARSGALPLHIQLMSGRSGASTVGAEGAERSGRLAHLGHMRQCVSHRLMGVATVSYWLGSWRGDVMVMLVCPWAWGACVETAKAKRTVLPGLLRAKGGVLPALNCRSASIGTRHRQAWTRIRGDRGGQSVGRTGWRPDLIGGGTVPHHTACRIVGSIRLSLEGHWPKATLG